jgi:hypothetical protein
MKGAQINLVKPMKKLVSLSCLILYLDGISHANPEMTRSSLNSSGEKTLVKAIATMVGREKDKKIPGRFVELPPAERPY